MSGSDNSLIRSSVTETSKLDNREGDRRFNITVLDISRLDLKQQHQENIKVCIWLYILFTDNTLYIYRTFIIFLLTNNFTQHIFVWIGEIQILFVGILVFFY